MIDFSLLMLVLLPIGSTFVSFFIGKYSKRKRDYFVMLIAALELLLAIALLIQTSKGNTFTYYLPEIGGRGILLKLDGFRAIYCVITAFMWLITSIISREYFHHYRNRNRYHFFNLFTLGATIGVLLSADFFTTYIFFEIMTFTSFVMVINNEKPDSMEAAKLYVMIAFIGGLVMLMGINLLNDVLGTIEFEAISQMSRQMTNKSQLYLPGFLIFFGFAVKAGVVPVHVWLPEAHPAAPAPASALLSGILTKTGIFGVLIVSFYLFYHNELWGMFTLSLGVLTMFVGALLALFTIDIKRVLACSSISQIGFILIGIGMQNILAGHNALAVRGTLLHMVNHSLIKLALFMAAGIIYINIHELNLNQVRGFGKGKPVLHLTFLLGALGITGIPFFNGYVSKTLLHESIVEHIDHLEEIGAATGFFQGVEVLFLIAGGMTVAYMLKLYIAIFLETNQDPEIQKVFDQRNGHYMRKKGAFALLGSAILIPILGSFTKIMDAIADLGQSFMFGAELPHAVDYFTWINLKGAVYSIVIGGLLYCFFIRGILMSRNRDGVKVYLNQWPEWLNINEIIYKPFILKILPSVGSFFARSFYLVGKIGFEGIIILINKSVNKDRLKEDVLREKKSVNKNSQEKIEHLQIWENISCSISYSLLLFGVGLIIAMVYLLNIG